MDQRPPSLFTRLRNLSRDALAVWMSIRDPKVPWSAKATALVGLLYLISPIDLIPDVMPIIGWLDDVAMLPLAGYLVSRLIPFQLMEELRQRAETKIARWGPKAVYLAGAVVLLWLGLALGGMYFLWREWKTGEGPASAAPIVTPSPNVP